MSLAAAVITFAFLAGPIARLLCWFIDWYYDVPPPSRLPRRWWKR